MKSFNVPAPEVLTILNEKVLLDWSFKKKKNGMES